MYLDNGFDSPLYLDEDGPELVQLQTTKSRENGEETSVAKETELNGGKSRR